ncbi:MAG: DUF502 domain-containing protein [candidate division KSB1 bacterium]|nr:DUF502 domain-containing protein [candidate division KSB1 bacterium]MDZ7392181.1 DUF502 domain-containing protein [candidate division KSB1 bacterium]MDZ7414362.1 DUF502 domain-containing protein [candidate division KSB1 bacterium]
MPAGTRPPGPARWQSWRKVLRTNAITGLVVIVPLVLSLFVLYRLFVAIDGLFKGVVGVFLAQRIGLTFHGRPIPGLGLVALVLLIFLTGLVARNIVGRRLIAAGEEFLGRVPLLNWVYKTFQQILQAFVSDKREVFSKVVLVEYPRKGLYSLGFITQDTKGPIQDRLESDVYSVFLPTTPNPTSGLLLFVPKEEAKEVDMSVEEALKLVVSGGTIVPPAGEGRARGRRAERLRNRAPRASEGGQRLPRHLRRRLDDHAS